MTSRQGRPTENQIEDYVLGRLTGECAQEMRRRIESCGETRSIAQRCRSDAAFVREIAASAGETEAELTLQDLALFLDDALTPEERERILTQLAVSASDRRRLVQLYHEVRMAACDEQPELSDMTELSPPENALALNAETRRARAKIGKSQKTASSERTEEDAEPKQRTRRI